MIKKDEKFKKITNVSLPFDRRDPDPKKNYGIHGLDIWFVLKGPAGAVQYAVTFDVHLPHVERNDRPKWKESIYSREKINGFDVGYHSPKPMFEGQTTMDCLFLEGGKCYYDGSSLQAHDWTKEIFSVVGENPEKVLWDKLEYLYNATFGEPK